MADQNKVRGAFLNTQGGVTLCQSGREAESFGFADYLFVAAPAVPAPEAPTDDDDLFAAKFYSSARPAPDVGGLVPAAQPADAGAAPDFVQAAKDFADAHIACDELEARDDADPEAVAGHELNACNARYNLTKARLVAARRVNLAAPEATSEQMGGAQVANAEHEFKNFHRMLCDRFGYTHDEKDWKRDQVSLIEFIAATERKPLTDAVAESLRQVGQAWMSEDGRDALEDWIEQHHGIGSGK